MSSCPKLLQTLLTKGTQLVTTKPVTLCSRMVPIAPWTHQGGPAVAVPAGSVLTYTGDYMFGSDPGPGFPEFDIKTPIGETAHGHACGATLEYWGRIVEGWCEPHTPKKPRKPKA